jgi:hypothetical protein
MLLDANGLIFTLLLLRNMRSVESVRVTGCHKAHGEIGV